MLGQMCAFQLVDDVLRNLGQGCCRVCQFLPEENLHGKFTFACRETIVLLEWASLVHGLKSFSRNIYELMLTTLPEHEIV